MSIWQRITGQAPAPVKETLTTAPPPVSRPAAPRGARGQKRSVDVNWGLGGVNHAIQGQGGIGDVFRVYEDLRIAGHTLNKNAAIYRELRTARAVSRYLTKNSIHARNVMDIMRDGIMDRDPDRPSFSGLIPEDLQNQIGDAWQMWWGSAAPFIDSVKSGVEVERDILGSAIEDGDALVRFVKSGAEVLMMHYTADQFYEYSPAIRGDRMNNFMGVEFNQHGCPTGYDMLERSALAAFIYNTAGSVEHVVYPANQCIHVKMDTTAHELRGLPYISQAIYNMVSVRAFDTNATAAMALAAKLIGWVEVQPESNSNYGDGVRRDNVGTKGSDGLVLDDEIDVPDDHPDRAQYRKEAEQIATSMGLNSALILQAGQEFKTNSPQMPTTAIQGFREQLIQEFAAATGFSTSEITKDYARGNFSGARQGLVNDTKKHKHNFQWWTNTVRTPIYRRWLMGYLGTRGMGGMNEVQLNALLMPKWSTPVAGWIDPRSESLAVKAQLEMGIRSPRDVIEEMGYDYDKTMDDIIHHEEWLQKANLTMGKGNAAMPDEDDGKRAPDGDLKSEAN